MLQRSGRLAGKSKHSVESKTLGRDKVGKDICMGRFFRIRKAAFK